MKYRDTERRLTALEQRNGSQVIGITGIWNHHPGMVELAGSDEEMLIEEWEQRYPGGLLIRVQYVDKPAERAG